MNISMIIKPACVQICLLAVQTLLYMLVQKPHKGYRDVSSSYDDKIPFVPAWIFVYVLWFPLVFIYPVYLYCCSSSCYLIYMASIAGDIVLSSAIYLLFPASFKRPEPPKKGLTGLVFRFIRRGNYKGLNCLPSMHCSMCFIVCATAVMAAQVMPAVILTIFITVSGLIVISTVFTKQHVISDVIAAVPAAAVCLGAAVLLV